MNEEPTTSNLRRLSGLRASIVFFRHVFGLINFIWPVFSMLSVVIVLLGLISGIREGWNIGDSFYYAFITAFTIGYGDFSPTNPLTKLIAVVIELNATGNMEVQLAVPETAIDRIHIDSKLSATCPSATDFTEKAAERS